MLVRPLWAVSEHGYCAIVIVDDSNECRESGLSQLDRRVLSACHFCVGTSGSASECVGLDIRGPRAVPCVRAHVY